MNMSYCRFENTSRDLADCASKLDDMFDRSTSPLSFSELIFALQLVRRCCGILEAVSTEVGVDTSELLDMTDRDRDAKVGTVLGKVNQELEEEAS